MNPNVGIAPQMSTNEAVRRQLFLLMDENGRPKPGAPGGPPAGAMIGASVTAAAADPAALLVDQDTTGARVGGLLRNLGSALSGGTDDAIWYGSDPAVTDADGAWLLAGESVPINISGPIYIFKNAGTPSAQFTPILKA